MFMYMKKFISDYYRELLPIIKEEVLCEEREQIIGVEVEEMTGYYLQKHALQKIEFSGEKELVNGQEVKKIHASERDPIFRSLDDTSDISIESEFLIIKLFIEKNPWIDLLKELVSSQHFTFIRNEIEWQEEYIQIKVETKGYGINLTVEQINEKLEKEIEDIYKIVEWKNKDIENESKKIKDEIYKIVEARKNEIQKSNEKIENLSKIVSIPLNVKPGKEIKKIPLKQQDFLKKIKPNPSLPKEEKYVLDEEKVKSILDLIQNQAETFERTPQTINKLGEEDIRNLFLATLNSVFEGKATGETFSKKGKTDIYLNIERGNILIFECKFWNGEKTFEETILQLTKYLTWRENYGVIIFFVKRKNFINILNSISEQIEKQNSYIKDSFCKKRENYFVSKNLIDEDKRQVQIHYLLYNLYA